MRQSVVIALGHAALGLSLLLPPPAEGAPFRRTVPFALDEWVDVGLQDGPVTIHRLRIARKSGLKGFKSVVSRPGNTEFLQDVQVQIEYSNGSTSDWEVKASVVWLDANDQVIDGYRGGEGLDDGASHELATMLLSTLKYGLEQARKLLIELAIQPD
jgi:hypothetical protein